MRRPLRAGLIALFFVLPIAGGIIVLNPFAQVSHARADDVPTPDPSASPSDSPSPDASPSDSPTPSPSAPQEQVLTFTHVPASRATTATVDLVAATSTSGLAVALTSEGPCTLDNGVVTYSAAGTCTITASQAGDASYLAAPPITTTVTVSAPAAYAIPVLSATSQDGMIMLTARVDRRDAGKQVIFFIRSGMTKVVRSLGVARTDASGAGSIVTHSAIGGHLRMYAREIGVPASRAYSHDIAFTVR